MNLDGLDVAFVYIAMPLMGLALLYGLHEGLAWVWRRVWPVGRFWMRGR